MALGWRVYYTDGSIYDDSMGAPRGAPALGVVCVVQPNPDTGRVVLTRWDWYVYREDEQQWWGHDLFGLLDQLTHDYGGVISAVKAGRMLSSPTYQAILRRAEADPEFPVRSARQPWERDG